MTEISSTPISTKLRYRMYFWLMDASFAVIVFALAGEVLDALTGVYAFGLPEVLAIAFQVIGIPLGLLLPTFLISIPAWRDEYADLLWKKTVGVIVIVFAVVPMAVFICVWIVFFIVGGDEPPEWLGPLFAEKSLIGVILRIWYVFTASFVVIFQIVRWSDSR